MYLAITSKKNQSRDCRYGAAGNWKHCAAVAVYMNRKEVESCTSQPQTWRMPSKTARSSDRAPIHKLFGGKLAH